MNEDTKYKAALQTFVAAAQAFASSVTTLAAATPASESDEYDRLAAAAIGRARAALIEALNTVPHMRAVFNVPILAPGLGARAQS